MKAINSYEDALKALGREHEAWVDNAPKHIRALYKLETICKALNVGHAKGGCIYFPYWWNRKELLGDIVHYGAYDGLGCVSSNFRFSGANTYIGSRLCSFNRETALYLGSETFIKLWQDYLL